MTKKYTDIAADLRSRIKGGAYSETRKLPTEHALAEQYGANRQTIRHALAVLTEEGLIETKQGSGSYLSAPLPEQGHSIAILASYINDYIFPAILQDAQRVFSESGYATLLYCTGNEVSRERDILLHILDNPVCGILAEGTKTALPNPNLDLYQRIHSLGIPIVFLHGAYPQIKDSICISDDDFGGGYLLTKYLLQKGHKNIAGIFKSDDIQGLNRYNGYLSAFRDRGLPLPDSNILWFSTKDKSRLLKDHDLSVIGPFVNAILHRCTAVVCYNDEIAFSLISLLQKQKIKIPQEMAVVSFDDSYYSELSPVRITSLAHGTHHIGRLAAKALIDTMKGTPAKSLAVSWKLIEKESC
ncbi:MAG: GntR family transcriptional regulator [Oscillospiraceae bacterium]|jgi:GntR family transcriptional regulator of arabinose operon|nr:GntR family transcriptional regulator [Oscillospiraceae bacterium]MDD3260501.1 GntR family transcriptional regulator [Oscillospiraceae bacterium]